MAYLSLILAIIALIPLAAYLWLRLFYSPSVAIRVGGDQQGNEPIQLPERGSLAIGISATSNLKLFITEVWVSFPGDGVDLSKTRGGEVKITTDSRFPLAILFSERRAVRKGYLQANYFDYKAGADHFSVKITARTEVDEPELPFLLNMFPAPKKTTERIVHFKIIKGMSYDLKKIGLKILPNEELQMEGAQAQEAILALAEKDTAHLKMMTITKPPER